MKKIGIGISRSDVLTEVDRQTALTGQKRADTEPGAFEHNATQVADHEAMAAYWDDARTALTTACGPYVAAAVDGLEGLSLTLTVPDRHDASKVPGMATDARNFMVWAVAARWFAQTDTAAAQLATQTAQGLIDDFTRRLYARTAPERPTH